MLRSMSLIAVQTEAHAQRFLALGADPEVVRETREKEIAIVQRQEKLELILKELSSL